MERQWLIFLMALAPLVTGAQDSAPDGFELWTAGSLKQIEKVLATEAAGDRNSVRRLQDFSKDTFMLAHREADGVVEWHETQADIFLVQSGSATLLVGGTIDGAETVEPHEKRNGTIHGGIRVKLVAGDITRIPAKVPPQVLLEGAKQFTYFVIKVKGY